MRTIYGKQVFDTLAERVEPRHTALVVIDMQNDFGHADGYFASIGKDTSRIRQAAGEIAELVEVARASGVVVVWLKRGSLLNGRSDSPASLAYRSNLHDADDPVYTVEGTWGHEIMEPLRPAEGEPVIVKYRSSGFVETPLDLILRSNEIKTVVLCGCVTEGCVDSTARSASFHEYYTEVVEDCVASARPQLHDAALTILRSYYGVAKRDAYIEAWKNATHEVYAVVDQGVH